MAIGVAFGGPSPEHDVSVLTGLLAARALVDTGETVEPLYWSKAGDWYAVDAGLEGEDFVGGVPRGAKRLQLVVGAGGGFVEAASLGRRRKVDVSTVVNCCHGGPGEDGTIQAAFDLAGVKYTGPTAAGAGLGMDKLAFASVVAAAGLPHLPCVAVDPAHGTAEPFAGPYILKPRFGGSSIGIETFDDWASVLAFLGSPRPALRDGAVVEPFRGGAVDIEVAVRRYPALELSAISKPLRGDASILGYREKYVGGEGMISAPRELPANLSAPIAAAIDDATRRVASVAAVRGLARVDFLLDGDDLFVNEINTIPGSLTKHLWVDPPVAFSTLLADMIAEASSVPARQFVTTGADGSALRSAGTIAGKLG